MIRWLLILVGITLVCAAVSGAFGLTLEAGLLFVLGWILICLGVDGE